MKAFMYETIIGRIGIAEKDNGIARVYFGTDRIADGIEVVETELISEAASQLREYLDGRRREFSLPLSPSGTDFMKDVWRQLQEIPYGSTASYKEVAERIGRPRAVRAVGRANNLNPIPIFIPCHRVIGSNGKLVGYAGGLDLKKHLLDLESKHTLVK